MIIKKRTFDRLFDDLFQLRCVHCSLHGDGRYICNDCKKSLHQYKPESFITRLPNRDWHIEDAEFPLQKVFYLYKYTPVIHSLVEAVKYHGYRDMVREITYLCLEADDFPNIISTGFDYLGFIPLTKKKFRIRTFNQTELMVKELSYQLGIPVLSLLAKTTETRVQADLNRNERLSNLKGVFRCNPEYKDIIAGRKILLLDDICTTGSTLIECSKTIKATSPTTDIYALCLARG